MKKIFATWILLLMVGVSLVHTQPAFSALARLKPTTILEDASVPRSKLPEMLLKIEDFAREESVLVGNFGHLGDGNLHPTCLINERDSDEVHRSERFF